MWIYVAPNGFWRIDWTFSEALLKSPKQLQRFHFPAEHLPFAFIPSFFFCLFESLLPWSLLLSTVITVPCSLYLFLSLIHIWLIPWAGAARFACEWKNRCWIWVSEVMNYLSPKHFWSCHSSCIGRERSIRRLTLVLITAIWPLKWRFCAAQRYSRLGAGWGGCYVVNISIFSLIEQQSILHPSPSLNPE